MTKEITQASRIVKKRAVKSITLSFNGKISGPETVCCLSLKHTSCLTSLTTISGSTTVRFNQRTSEGGKANNLHSECTLFDTRLGRDGTRTTSLTLAILPTAYSMYWPGYGLDNPDITVRFPSCARDLCLLHAVVNMDPVRTAHPFGVEVNTGVLISP